METIRLTINGEQISARSGMTVAAAILNAGILHFRDSVNGRPRAPLCGMGLCYECRVMIDGEMHQKSCQILVRNKMSVETNGND